jgi:flavin-dependent dehydrogenase
MRDKDVDIDEVYVSVTNRKARVMYDVVIVGAGPGGCIAAKTLENSGLKVCIVERKPKNQIGEKVCGDAIGKHHFDFLHRNIGLEYPSEEVKAEIKGIKIFSPDRKTFFTTETREGGYMIDRLLFGQRMIAELGDTELLANTALLGFGDKEIIINRKGRIDKIQAEIVVDASGMQAVLRKQIDSPYIENQIVGVQYPINPKDRFYQYIKGKPFENSKIIHASGGVVPVRRTLDSLVALQNGLGFMFVGDVACQANPIHGGGIGQAMTAGYLAGSVIKRIIGDITLENLWEYNLAWMKDYGSRNAGLDLFRIFLQNLTDEHINFGMGHKLIREEDLLKTSEGKDLELTTGGKLERAVRGIAKVNLLNNLQFVANKMKEIKCLYRGYPSSAGFFEWKAKVRSLYQEFYDRLV